MNNMKKRVIQVDDLVTVQEHERYANLWIEDQIHHNDEDPIGQLVPGDVCLVVIVQAVSNENNNVELFVVTPKGIGWTLRSEFESIC